MSWIYGPITKELPPNYNGLNPLPSGGACLLHIKESVRSTTDCGAGGGAWGHQCGASCSGIDWWGIVKIWQLKEKIQPPFVHAKQSAPLEHITKYSLLLPPNSSSYFIYRNAIVFHRNSLLMTSIKNVFQWSMKKLFTHPSGSEKKSTFLPTPNFTPSNILDPCPPASMILFKMNCLPFINKAFIISSSSMKRFLPLARKCRFSTENYKHLPYLPLKIILIHQIHLLAFVMIKSICWPFWHAILAENGNLALLWVQHGVDTAQ